MKLLTLTLLSVLMFACGNSQKTNGHPENDYEALTEISITEQATPTTEPNQQQVSKKSIKTGQIHFETESVKKEYSNIKNLLSSYDSYIGSENETNAGYRINYDISVRVASQNYDSLFNKLSRLSSKVEFKSSTIKDVTEHFYDLKTRIKNKKLLEEKYVALLKKATTIKDILEIERSINQNRNEIETAEGSFRYLKKQVAYSTIQLSFYEVLPKNHQAGDFWNRATHAISNGWNGFLTSLINITQYWPWLITLSGFFFIYNKVKAYRKTKD